MERKFYPENFERFLKGHADQFKMSPSKKVWHGIYNDLHPGRRWPSIAMTMVFIFTLVIIGHLNTNTGHTQLYDPSAVKNSLPENLSKTVQAQKRPGSAFSNRNNFNQNTPDITTSDNIRVVSPVADMQVSRRIPNEFSKNETNYYVAIGNKNGRIDPEKIENGLPTAGYPTTDIPSISDDVTNNHSKVEFVNAHTANNHDIAVAPRQTTTNSLQAKSTTDINKLNKKNKVTWTYYLSPSVSYRNFSDDKVNNAVTHKIRIGYEAGTAMSFNLYKKLQLTTGVQFNYSGYNIKANNTHPIVASVLLNSETQGQHYTHYTMSTYANSTRSELTTLKNYSFNASLPIGLQYEFGTNDNITFGAAAAIQPSILIASKAYLLSTDRKNYLSAPDLMRSLNINTSFTTYISIASNSFNWQIGPQVRYQVLSTYSNRYPVNEHLVNYGIRLGISKSSK